MRKNQYEEALFRCEDDRFELDMCIETNASTLKKLRPLRDLFATMTPEDRALWRLPESELGAIHFRAVERIYGDQVGTHSGNIVDRWLNPLRAVAAT
jgi:paired amphipathic helix protein Sin3a